MGLLSFLENKTSEFADRNTDDHLRRLGFDMSRFTGNTQESIRRDCMNAQYMYSQATGTMAPFSVAECALLKLTWALIRAERTGNTEIATQALETMPRLQRNFAGKMREDVVSFTFDLLDSAARQLEADKASDQKPAQALGAKLRPTADNRPDPQLRTVSSSSRASPWSEYDRPAASRRRK